MRYFLWDLPDPDLFYVSRGLELPTECYIKESGLWEDPNKYQHLVDENLDISKWILKHSVEISYSETMHILLNPNQETVDLILREKQK